MGDPQGPALRITRTAVDLLDQAARRAESSISTALGDGPESGRAIEILRALAARVRRRLSQQDAGATDAPPFDPVIVPVTRTLRRELLAAADSPEAAAATIEVLAALEGLVGDADTSAGGREGGTEDLGLRLRAPDAFHLLVEVAHDFRSPLTSILFLSETLREGNSGPVTDVQRSQLGLIYGAAFELAGMASDVMELAQGGRDLVDVPEPYSARELFSSVERLVRPIVEEKGLRLEVSLPGRSKLAGHPLALSRVLLNLTTNALKCTDTGSVEIGAVARPHDRVEFYVEDTGRGIPEELRAEIFEPFKRGSNDASSGPYFSGGGVGLSIAQRLVRAMGSELEFRTSERTGTRFWFVVPAEASTPATGRR